ncbi:STAS domain-containing protein [bacterium]|nr:STAS domain-containing protein [bacterium]
MDHGVQINIDYEGANLEIAIIRVTGLIDTDTSRSVSRALEDVIAKKQFKVIMDLSRVDYISSAGWGIFIGELKELRRQGGDLKLACLTPEVDDIFKLLEFFNVLSTFDAVEDAVRSFGT